MRPWAEKVYGIPREHVIGRLDKALNEAQARAWIVVDMKRDWKVIYSLENGATR